MKTITLQLFDIKKHMTIKGITSFVAEDESGGFGLLPGHARFMTVLVFGLARFRCVETPWKYLAMPGAVLYFSDDSLDLVCRHYLIDEDYDRISQRLADELIAEEEQLRDVRQSLKSMEEALLRRIWEIGRQGMVVK